MKRERIELTSIERRLQQSRLAHLVMFGHDAAYAALYELEEPYREEIAQMCRAISQVFNSAPLSKENEQ